MSYKVSNIADVFLMVFWRKEGFKLLLPIVHLTDVANFFQCRFTLAHNRSLAVPIVDLFNTDRARSASVDNALVILDGSKLSFIVENGPIFLEQSIDLLLNTHGEVREIDEPAQNCSMSCLIVCDKKLGSTYLIGGAGCLRLCKIVPPLMLWRITSNSCD